MHVSLLVILNEGITTRLLSLVIHHHLDLRGCGIKCGGRVLFTYRLDMTVLLKLSP